MKILARTLVLAAVLCPAAVHAASFEGKVSFKMTSDGKAQDMVYNIKGDKIRLEMPGVKGMGGMILDTTKKETTMIMDEQRMYMTMAMPDAAPTAQKGKNEDVKLENTGMTETILGYTATKYLSTAEGTTTEMWLAEGLGTFMSAGGNPMAGGRRGGGSPAPQAWERALAGKELFPLRVVGKNKSGKETFRMEATSINKQSLPESMFAPPAGYQKFDMGGMMKGMIPGR